MTRTQRHVLTLCARPEGYFARLWDFDAVYKLDMAGLIEKRGVVYVATSQGFAVLANIC